MASEPVRILVVYDSWTGNVEKMAHAVAEGAREAGAEVKVVRVDDVDVDEVPQYGGYAFGTPTHCGTMSYKMNYFFNKQLIKYWGRLRYKVAVAFTSSGGLGGGSEVALLSLISTILNFGMMTFGVPDYVARGVTLHYGAVAVGAPDENSIKACRLLGRRLVEHVRVVKAGLKSLGQT